MKLWHVMYDQHDDAGGGLDSTWDTEAAAEARQKVCETPVDHEDNDPSIQYNADGLNLNWYYFWIEEAYLNDVNR